MLPNRKGSNSSNDSRNRKNSTKNRLYQPSIYRYYCRGAFSADSRNVGSTGTCRGLKSRLELLGDMELSTRADALSNFTYMTDYELDDGGSEDLSEQTKSILLSPALVYKSKRDKEKTPEEELIKRQEWKCYGSTEVEYLVLKDADSGESTVAAVAPRTSGVSYRSISTTNESLTSAVIGPINIVLQSSGSGADSDLHEEDDNAAESIAAARPEVPPKPSESAIEVGKDTIKGITRFGGLVAKAWWQQAQWFYGTIQDDFPNRVIQSGQRIAQQYPSTVISAYRYFSKTLNRYFGDDDESDEGR